jgi:hypothetical protein
MGKQAIFFTQEVATRKRENYVFFFLFRFFYQIDDQQAERGILLFTDFRDVHGYNTRRRISLSSDMERKAPGIKSLKQNKTNFCEK